MAILINDNYSLQAENKAFDARYLDINVPWASCAAAIAGIPTYRYPGLTINISNEEWWWKDGIGDSDLELKSLGGVSNLSGATNGLSLANSGTTVVLGGTLTGNTTISASTNYFKVEGASTDTSLYVGPVQGLANGASVNTEHGFYATCVESVSDQGSGNIANIDMYACLSATSYGMVNVSDSLIDIYSSNDANTAQHRITFGNPTFGIRVKDTCGSIGMTYTANYCSVGQLNPRWIPDNAYVAGLTTSASNVVSVCNVNAIYTATTLNDFIGVSGATCIFLPATPKACQRITIADIEGDALTNNIEVNGNGSLINGSACATINTDYGSMTFINNNTGVGGVAWSAVAFIN